MYTYKCRGTCSREIQIETNGDTVVSVRFIGGCPGNTQGVSRLAEGRSIDDVIGLLSGIRCRNGTSCPDQLAKALRQIRMQRGAQ
ncbi:MAG: TIGR03905 family TSCPD domain-containing protein [Christensenellales bacterium]|jgi:uncharacterized protein (TIGR03905 family)